MHNKKLAFMFGFGILSFTSGAVSAYIEQHVSGVAAGMCVVGIAALLICLIQHGQRSPQRLTLSRWKKAGSMVLVTVFAVLFFIGINYLTANLPWRWDVTQSKQHTLTRSTIDFVKGLKQDVQFSALYVGIPPTYLENLFKGYERASLGKIKTEIIDPIEQIGYAAQFGNVIDGKSSKVVVRSGKERRDIDFTKAPLSEEQMTNALMRVTRKERKVCFVTGHQEYSLTDKGEQGLTKLAQALEDNNMSSREVMLGVEDKVPADCDVLVVAGPHQELTEKEEAAINAYLSQGGDALFLVENLVMTTPDKPLTAAEIHKNPSLNKILNPWGVTVGDDVVVDLDSHAGEDVGCPATRNYAAHKAITEGLDYTFYVRPRSLTVLKDRRPTVKLASIVSSASKEKSWAETDRTLNVVFDPLLDTLGSIAMGFVMMEEKKAGISSDTRVIVFTDADFLTNAYVDQYSNARLGLNVISWLAEADPGLVLDAKEIKVERLDLTSQQRRAVAAILFLIPLIIAVGGVLMWIKL